MFSFLLLDFDLKLCQTIYDYLGMIKITYTHHSQTTKTSTRTTDA